MTLLSILGRVGRISPRAEVGQLLRQDPQAAYQPALYRHRRYAEQLGGVHLREPLDADQVECLRVVIRERLDGPEHTQAVRGEPGAAGGRRRHELLAQIHCGRLYI
jgi:hypothetical protein